MFNRTVTTGDQLAGSWEQQSTNQDCMDWYFWGDRLPSYLEAKQQYVDLFMQRLGFSFFFFKLILHNLC